MAGFQIHPITLGEGWHVMAKGRVGVNEERCKSCGLWVAACPMKVLRISDRINSKGYRTSREVARWDAAIEARIVAIGATPPGQGE